MWEFWVDAPPSLKLLLLVQFGLFCRGVFLAIRLFVWPYVPVWRRQRGFFLPESLPKQMALTALARFRIGDGRRALAATVGCSDEAGDGCRAAFAADARFHVAVESCQMDVQSMRRISRLILILCALALVCDFWPQLIRGDGSRLPMSSFLILAIEHMLTVSKIGLLLAVVLIAMADVFDRRLGRRSLAWKQMVNECLEVAAQRELTRARG